MKTYPESNLVESRWFESLPATWLPVRAKWLFSNESSRSTELDGQLAASQKYGVIPHSKMIELNSAKVMLALKGTENFKKVSKNDFVISLRSFQGGIEHSIYDGCISPAYTVLRAKGDQISSNYFKYALKCQEFIGALNATSDGIRDGKTITYSQFGELVVAFPPLFDQESIAAYLDHNTTRIDALIAEKQAFIKLLKEKRQALISHVVTKGLDPNVEFKDSGVEWLGEVPKHWICKRYKYAAQIYRGKFGHRPRNDPAFYDGDYPFIQTGDIARAGNEITKYKQTLNEKGKSVSQRFPSGTLVMAIAANIGDTAILGFEAYAPDSVVGFKPNKSVTLEFLRHSLNAALPALEQTSTKNTQSNLNIDRIGAVVASFPPLDEQARIIDFLQGQDDRLNTLTAEVKRSVELLKEHRTALISAAVTGKIDVREST